MLCRLSAWESEAVPRRVAWLWGLLHPCRARGRTGACSALNRGSLRSANRHAACSVVFAPGRMLACLGVRLRVRAGFRVFSYLARLGFERVRVPPWAEVFALGEIATQCGAWILLHPLDSSGVRV